MGEEMNLMDPELIKGNTPVFKIYLRQVKNPKFYEILDYKSVKSLFVHLGKWDFTEDTLIGKKRSKN
jgi:hypothetical protein